MGPLEEGAHLLGVGAAQRPRRARGGRRRTGSPSRWGSVRRWCAAGGGSPPARGVAMSLRTVAERHLARARARRAPSRPAGRCRCTSTTAREDGGLAFVEHAWVGGPGEAPALDAAECQPLISRSPGSAALHRRRTGGGPPLAPRRGPRSAPGSPPAGPSGPPPRHVHVAERRPPRAPAPTAGRTSPSGVEALALGHRVEHPEVGRTRRCRCPATHCQPCWL